MNRATLVACLVAALTAACATRGAVYQAVGDLRLLQADMRALQADLPALQSELGALRQSQEDLSRRLTEATNATRAAQARTEQQREASAASVKADVERLSAKVSATDQAIRDVKETLAARAAAPPPGPTPAPVAAAPPAPAPPRPTPASSAETAFKAGLANFRNREYGQAVLDFLDVVTRHPRHELASTAQYLIAEAYYLQRDYRQALVEYQRAIEWATPHPKVADALLKAGLCHSRLREPTQAQQAWRRVVREFPEAPAAEEARALLDGKQSVPTASRP